MDLIWNVFLIGLGVIILLHQKATHGHFIEWKDINNHETIAIALMAFSLGNFLAHPWMDEPFRAIAMYGGGGVLFVLVVLVACLRLDRTEAKAFLCSKAMKNRIR